MRRVLLSVAILFAFSCALPAQPPPANPPTTTTDPTGKACAANSLLNYIPSGRLFTCDATGHYAAAGGGGAPSGPAGGDFCTASTYPNPTVCKMNNGSIQVYPAGIVDPSAVVVSAVGATTATTYGYQVVLSLTNESFYNGAATTLPSPESTIVGNSTLDGTNYNRVTLPNEADSNIFCVLVRSTGPQSPQVIYSGNCGPSGGTDGMGHVDDQSNGRAKADFAYSQNNTRGAEIITFFNGASYVLQSQAYSSQAAGYLSSSGVEGGNPGDFIASGAINSVNAPQGWNALKWPCFGFNCGRWDIAYAGPAWSVQLVDGSNAPYTATRNDGFLRVDASAAGRTVNLPDPTIDDNFPQGRVYIAHKVDSTANPLTVTAPMGTTINGAASYVSTCPYATVGVYAEGYAGNAGNWPTFIREPLCGAGTLGGNVLVAGACDTPITVTIAGAASGMVVLVTPEGSPGAGTFTQQWVSSANTVTAQVCDSVAGTPASLTYDFRVIQ